MIGSIIGDIAGSIYEFNNIKTKDFPLFDSRGDFTDDSVLTFATADWLLNGGNVAGYYLRYGWKYPNPVGSYGGSFKHWLMMGHVKETPDAPYNSCGNGSAMRVGPVGWAFDTVEETLQKAEESAACTHNHPAGIAGAQAVALCIFMARKGHSKAEIKQTIEDRFGYNLNITVAELQESYGWESKWGNGGICQASVPQAICCFLEGEDFEDCIRNAVSIGGDSDTIGCITGSIAEAFFGVPRSIYEQAEKYLDADVKKVLKAFEEKFGKKIIDS